MGDCWADLSKSLALLKGLLVTSPEIPWKGTQPLLQLCSKENPKHSGFWVTRMVRLSEWVF